MYSLVGVNGNAYAVMGYVVNAMRTEKMSAEDIEQYKNDAMSADYNHLLLVSVEMVDFLNEKYEEYDDYDDEDDF